MATTLNKSKHSAENILKLYTEIAKIITSSLELTDVLSAIMKQVDQFFKPRNWSLLRVDETHDELSFVIVKGIKPELVKHLRIKAGEGIAGYVAQTGKMKIVSDVNNDPQFSAVVDQVAKFKTRSVIAAPIIFQGKTLGVIELINIKNIQLSKFDWKILQAITDFAAIALTNAQRYERILQLASCDALTGLYNRARLDDLIASYKKSSQKKDRTSDTSNIIVACIDVNNLKYLNDHYGHKTGDEMLCKVSKEIQECCRETDFAFRTGGDEFVVIFTGIRESNVPNALKRLRKTLSQSAKPDDKFFGFSYGLASGTKSSIRQVIEKSDKNMYKNKFSKRKISVPPR